MKQSMTQIRKLQRFGIFLAFAALPALAVQANRVDLDAVRLVPDLPADVELNGDSSVKRWTCAGDDIDAVFETDLTIREFFLLVQDFLREHERGDDTANVPTGDGDVLRAYVEIRPKLLDCGNARMEKDLQKAVRADDYPVISYWFNGIEGTIRQVNDRRDGRSFEMDIRGTLELANEVREVVHTARVRIIDVDEFEISGRLPLRMTDFQIDPPSALFGLVRARDEFEVSYRFVVRPQTDSIPIPTRARPTESDKA